MRGTISNPGKPSQIPLILAVALHLGALVIALAAPHLLPEKIHLPEVYRVELYNAVELPPTPAPLPPAAAVIKTVPPPAANIISPPPPRRILPTAKPLPPSTPKPLAKPLSKPLPKPLAKPEAVSLAPLKERLQNEAREREEQVSQTQKRTDQLALLKLDLQKQRADEQAREATKKAREAIAETYRTTQTRKPLPQDNILAKPQVVTGGEVPAAPPVTPAQKEVALATFRSRVHARISPHWILPEHQDWDKNLAALIIIKIKADGTVTSTWFEKNSGNTRFDQYVKKAVDRSSPLPPLPQELGKSSEEIGVTFTPGGLK